MLTPDNIERSQRAAEMGGRRSLRAAGGFAAGCPSGFQGIGGGLVIVPLLTGAVRFPTERAMGTSLAAITAVSLAAILAELAVQRSNIHWATACFLTFASLQGSRAGGQILPHLPDKVLRVLFAGLLLSAAYRMVAPAGAARSIGAGMLDDRSALGWPITLAVGSAAGCSSV